MNSAIEDFKHSPQAEVLYRRVDTPGRSGRREEGPISADVALILRRPYPEYEYVRLSARVASGRSRPAVFNNDTILFFPLL